MPGERLVGRERHLRELNRLIEGVAAGVGHAVLLAGEAGAGKTRLAEEAAALAAAKGVKVAWVSCWARAAAPLSAWIDLASAVDADHGPVRRPDGDELDPELARAALVRHLVAAMRDAVGSRSTLLVVDDLQWSDPLSLRAIDLLVSSLGTMSAGLVATLREGDDPDPLLSEFARTGRRLIVPPLTSEELAALGLELTGHALSPARLDRLARRSAGNVLHARELLAAGDEDMSASADDRIGSRAAAMFGDRLAALSPSCRQLLQSASVIGRRFRLDALTEATGMDVATVLRLLDEAQQHRLVRPAGIGACEFAHPLIAEACYSSVDFARRVRLHRDTAEALERLHDRGLAFPASEVAHHYANAAPAGVAAKAVEYAERAGRESMAQLGYEDAAGDFGRALAALDLCPADLERRAELLLQLGDARAAGGDLPAARAAYEEVAVLARRQGWPEAFARAALGVGSGPGGFEVPPFDHHQIALLEEAAASASGVLRAHVLARLSVALSLTADAARRVALSDEAIALAREVGDHSALGYALASRCDVIASPEHAEERLAAGSEILACAKRAGDTRLELLARRLRVVALLERGDIDDVDVEIAAYAACAEPLGQVVYSWYVPLWRAMRAAMEGRLDASERLRAEAARLGRLAHSENAAMLAPSQAAMLACELHHGEQAIGFFNELVERWPDYDVMSRPALAYALAVEGDTARAKTVLDCVRIDAYQPEALGSEWLPSLVMLAHAVALTPAPTLAPALYTTLLPYRDRHAIDGIGGYFVGSVERPLGLLAALNGDLDVAAQHFERAVAHHRRLRAPLLVASTLRDEARALDDEAMGEEAAALFATLGITDRRRAEPSSDTGGGANTFRREGDGWLVGLGGSAVRMGHTKGMADLARLLARPGTEMHVLDLVADGPTLASAAPGDAIDDEARRRYRARLAEIDAEQADADERGDAVGSERLQVERDALIAELSAAYGLGGRARRRGDSAERARSTVTQRLRDAITRVEAVEPALGQHLRRSIRTGTFCSYAPEHPTEWVL